MPFHVCGTCSASLQYAFSCVTQINVWSEFLVAMLTGKGLLYNENNLMPFHVCGKCRASLQCALSCVIQINVWSEFLVAMLTGKKLF